MTPHTKTDDKTFEKFQLKIKLFHKRNGTTKTYILGEMGLGMMGQIQVTPRWENDTLWKYDGGNRREGRGGYGYLPPPREEFGRRADK